MLPTHEHANIRPVLCNHISGKSIVNPFCLFRFAEAEKGSEGINHKRMWVQVSALHTGASIQVCRKCLTWVTPPKVRQA